MITPEKKDSIIIDLINRESRDWLQIGPEEFDISSHLFGSLLKQFARRGLVIIKSSPGKTSVDYVISVEIDADDFIQRGGFKFEEDIFRNSFTKLELELAQLEKENPKLNFDNATKLITAMSAGFDIYSSLNT